jgi:uncharacterized protein (TIGR02453 family)
MPPRAWADYAPRMPTKTNTATAAAKTTSTKKPTTKKPTTKKVPKPKTTASAVKTPSTKARGVITPEAMAFIAELATRQDREWYEPRKADIKRLLQEPVLAVLRDVGAGLLDHFPAVEDAVPRVFGIHRDVRFSKDKSPYKDHVGGTLEIGGATAYLHVDGNDVWAAVGVYEPSPAQLQAFRAAVGDTPTGPKLLRATEALEQRGYEVLSYDALTRAPAGWSPTHPCIRLLRLKGWALKVPALPVEARSDGSLGFAIAAHIVAAKDAIVLADRAFSQRPG